MVQTVGHSLGQGGGNRATRQQGRQLTKTREKHHTLKKSQYSVKTTREATDYPVRKNAEYPVEYAARFI